MHSNIGGSYADTGLADLTLAWMISNLVTHGLVDVDASYTAQQRALNERFYRLLNPSQPPRPWGLGRVYDSFRAFYYVTGVAVRTPGRYERTDPRLDKPTGQRLVHTEETVHASVRIRMALGGKGPEDRGTYVSQALMGWECVAPDKDAPDATSPTAERQPRRQRHRWVSKKGKDVVVLPEDELGLVEIELMRLSPEVYKKFSGELI